MKNVKVSKSVEGNEPQIVEMPIDVVINILEYQKATDVIAYLMINGLLTDEVSDGLTKKINALKSLLNTSGYMKHKYDWRANYDLV
jgi:hypothetical protein